MQTLTNVINIRYLVIFLVFLLLSAPIISIVSMSFNITNTSYITTSSPLFPEYISNTILLMLGVASLTISLSTALAWFSTFFSFPGRKLLEMSLLFPLAIPSYVLAYVYAYSLDYSSPVQSYLRQVFDTTSLKYFPEIRSLSGAILIMSLALYPYVYIFVKARFLTMCNAICVSRTLGLSSTKTFFSVAAPIARPAIFAGVSLVLMEVLSDFGSLQFLSFNTITTGIYQSWFMLNDYSTAAKLASIACVIAIILITIEKISRGKSQYTEINSSSEHKCDCFNIGWHTSKLNKYLITLFCSIPVILGTIIPVGVLIQWCISSSNISDLNILTHIFNSITLASATGFFTVIIALLILYFSNKDTQNKIIPRILSLGYAMPGAIVAIGTLIALGSINDIVKNITTQYLPNAYGFLLIGTVSGLIYAYIFRFLAISIGSVESGFSRINTEIDHLSRIINKGHFFKLRYIYAPMIRNNIALAFILVFIDTIKELPATLIIRPFNFDTIAVKTYSLVIDERFHDASLPSLIIIAINIISIFILIRSMGLHNRR